MSTRAAVVLGLFFCSAAPARGQSPRLLPFSVLGLPSALTKPRLQGLLQGFVDSVYRKGFRHLGDERDCDHGHLLFRAADPQRPVAILYHTQELAHSQPARGAFGYVDVRGRNWLQWIDHGGVENASLRLRRDYPHTAFWDWFRALRLPQLEARHTIVDEMLDPVLGLSLSRQFEFTRMDCAGAPDGDASNVVRVSLPGGPVVCLALTAS